MRDYLLSQGFNEVATNHFLRPPLRVNIVSDGLVLWEGVPHREPTMEEIKRVIETTEFKQRIKK